jgi:hypothetical protein
MHDACDADTEGYQNNSLQATVSLNGLGALSKLRILPMAIPACQQAPIWQIFFIENHGIRKCLQFSPYSFKILTPQFFSLGSTYATKQCCGCFPRFRPRSVCPTSIYLI